MTLIWLVSLQGPPAPHQQNPVNNYVLEVGPARLSITVGGRGSFAVGIQAAPYWSDPVFLSVAGVPPGVIASFAPNPVEPLTYTIVFANLELVVSEAARPGDYDLVITSDSKTLVRRASVTLTIVAVPQQFELSLIPETVVRIPGDEVVIRAVVRTASRELPTFLAVRAPAGISVELEPSVIPPRSAEPVNIAVTIRLSELLRPGIHDVILSATQGNASRARILRLDIVARLALSFSDSDSTVRAGEVRRFTIQVREPRRPLQLAIRNPPEGIIVQLSPERITPPATLDLQIRVAPTVRPGTYSLLFQAVSDGTLQESTVPLRVDAPPATLSITTVEVIAAIALVSGIGAFLALRWRRHVGGGPRP